MIQLPHITLEPNCQFNGSAYFRIETVMPAQIVNHLVAAAREQLSWEDQGLTELQGMTLEVYQLEIEEDELVAGAFVLDGHGVYVEQQADGSFTFSMSCMKQPEGDDRYDTWTFEEAHDGKLPANFWIEPAAIIRKLIAATVH